MKTCAVINDLSGFGKCSLSVAIPIISVMGSEVHPLPTAVLSNQTAYSSYEMVSLTDSMNGFISQWKKHNAAFNAILTGFVCDEAQLDIISSFADEFKTDSTLLIVDPIMADNGALYDGYTPSMCEKIKKLCYKADIITPNIAELAFIAEEPYSESLDDIISYGNKLLQNGIKSIVVTGYKNGDEISNIVFDENGVSVSTDKLYGGYFSGTGDIFSSVITGGVLRGMPLREAAALATKFISTCARNTKGNSPNDGVDFERFLPLLIDKNFSGGVADEE